MAPVIDDVVPEVALHRDVAPARNAAKHVGEEVVVPRAAVSAQNGRKGMLLLVVAFRSDAPLHRVAVNRAGGGQRFGVAPTARAVVHDEVVTVVNAEAVGSELAVVISGAKTQEADDHVMCSRERESVPAALGFLDADAVAGGGLAGDGDIGFADLQPLRLDHAAYPEDHGARAFRLNRFAQTARTGVVEVRDEKNSATASALGIGAITLGAGECQEAASNGRLLRIHLAVELPIGGFDNGPIELKALRLAAGHIRNHSSIGSRNAGAG